MRKIWTIAWHTFKEAARDRVLYGLAAFGLLFLLVDIFFARLSLGDPVMIKSFGLAGIYLCGLVVTVFLGATIIHKEIERRTLYFVLSKPVSRAQFLLGKYFGLLAAIVLTVALMALMYLAVVWHVTGSFDARGLAAIILQMFEMALVTALLVFLSSVIRPLTATMCSVLLLFAGHLLPAMIENARIIGGATYRATRVLYYLLPNLAKFDIRGLAAHSLQLPPQMIWYAAAYAAAYSTALLLLAAACFKRREL